MDSQSEKFERKFGEGGRLVKATVFPCDGHRLEVVV